MIKKSKLIIIRGPSGSGKSTVARELLKLCGRPTVLVSEDQIRKLFSDHRRPGHKASKKLATAAVLLGLQDGYDVVYEGILDLQTSGDNLKDLFESHKGENYLFYLDVSFEETLRRHEMRPERLEFKAEAMGKWWGYALPTGHVLETVVPESSSLEETVSMVNKVANLGLIEAES